ncbi:hypothetical protein HMPREF9278_0567 [Mobiluncus mulieris FB024-16]|nr:hypothetical protein HMPREF9278_0567 [Mobiluncus mulieris FB024-16]
MKWPGLNPSDVLASIKPMRGDGKIPNLGVSADCPKQLRKYHTEDV